MQIACSHRGARSGEYGVCRSNSRCNSCSFAIVAIDLWHGVLSWWERTFSFSFVTIFWWFFPSYTPVMLYNICYGCFFLSPSNRWTKYLAKAKTLPVDICVFGRFEWLSPAAVHSADCRFDSRGERWIHVLSIITCLRKKVLFVWLKQLQTTLWIVDALLFLIDSEQRGNHFEHRYLIDKCSCKMVNTQPSGIFSSSAISCNFNLRSAKTSFGDFWCFPRTQRDLGDLSVQYNLSVRPHLKSAYHLLTIVSDGVET